MWIQIQNSGRSHWRGKAGVSAINVCQISGKNKTIKIGRKRWFLYFPFTHRLSDCGLADLIGLVEDFAVKVIQNRCRVSNTGKVYHGLNIPGREQTQVVLASDMLMKRSNTLIPFTISLHLHPLSYSLSTIHVRTVSAQRSWPLAN